VGNAEFKKFGLKKIKMEKSGEKGLCCEPVSVLKMFSSVENGWPRE
jgi:hypothetical protein